MARAEAPPQTVRVGVFITNLFDVDFARQDVEAQFWVWFNHDDLDFHMVEPGGEEIYFGAESIKEEGGNRLARHRRVRRHINYHTDLWPYAEHSSIGFRRG